MNSKGNNMKNDAFVHGIHHITAFSGDVNENIAFYTKTLGLRLVKKSVNQDAPDIYHLFFADAHGSPGTDLTFFPFPRISKAKDGYGIASEVGFAIPVSSLKYWKERLESQNVNNLDETVRFGENVLTFEDPHGLKLSLTTTSNAQEVILWEQSEVPVEHQIRGFHTVRLKLHTLAPTELLMTEIMGFRRVETADEWVRFESGEGGSGTYVDVAEFPEESAGRWGYGGVHHVAWRVKDAETEVALRKKIAGYGLQPSPVIDRFWFESVYFKEPNGVLFELATDGPGFDRDESLDKLGEELILPPWLENQRKQIEAALPKITV
jgi:glyoxalase family protein